MLKAQESLTDTIVHIGLSINEVGDTVVVASKNIMKTIRFMDAESSYNKEVSDSLRKVVYEYELSLEACNSEIDLYSEVIDNKNLEIKAEVKLKESSNEEVKHYKKLLKRQKLVSILTGTGSGIAIAGILYVTIRPYFQ